jgi:uncharacterized protein YutE (UPF0331/DUF86 family)
LHDIVERNLEIAAQCCIDILPSGFARRLAPLAGFRNILAHEYLVVDWDQVYGYLQKLGDLKRFREITRVWLKKRSAQSLRFLGHSLPA